MPGIARNSGTDVAGGPLIQGSSDVFANFLPAVRIGDAVAGHGGGVHKTPSMATGSSTVFVNNIAVCRSGDKATCGHTATGSSNVFVDGGGAGTGGAGGAPLVTGAGGGGNLNIATSNTNNVTASGASPPNVGNNLPFSARGTDPNFRIEDLEPEVLERQRGMAITVLVNGGYGPDGFVCTSRDSETGALIYYRGDALYGESTWVVFPDGSKIDRIPPGGDAYDIIHNAGYSGPKDGNYGISEDRITDFIVARNTTGELGGLDPDPISQAVETTWTGADGVVHPALRLPDGTIQVPDARVIVSPDGFVFQS